jgi:hypothetical protein
VRERGEERTQRDAKPSQLPAHASLPRGRSRPTGARRMSLAMPLVYFAAA